MQAASILFGFLFVVALCTAAGMPLVARLPLYREERWPMSFLLGSAVVSGVFFALASVHMMRRGVLLALLGVAIWAAWKYRWTVAVGFDAIPKSALYVFFGLFLPFSVLYWANAMAPEWSPDGSSYHLGWIRKYANARGFVSPEASMYGMLSQGVELLYLGAYLWGKHSAAAMVHWAFFLDLIWLMVCFGRRIGKPAQGLAAAFFVYASPVVGIDGTSAYIDLATAAIGFGLFYLLYIWNSERATGLLVAAGLLGGFTYAAKYTAAVLAVWGFVVVLLRGRHWRPAAVFAGMTLVLSAPWMIRNAVLLGNPLAPFFNKYFPNPHVHILFEKLYSEWLRHYDVPHWWELPLEVTIRGVKTGGALGYLFLLAPVALLALRWQAGRWLLGAALFAALPFPMNVGTRFLIPALPFVALAMALALEVRLILAGLMVAHALLAWPNWPPGLITKTSLEQSWRLLRVPWKAALRIEPEKDYLTRRSDGYRRAMLADAKMRPGTRVLRVNGFAESYTDREILVGYQSANNEKLQDILYIGADDSRWPKLHWNFRFPQDRLVKRFRLEQTFAVQVVEEQWNVTEVRLYQGDREVPRDPAWRLMAKPNPWDVQMAFDNSPVTRWRSWETARPGMYMDVDLARPQALSRIRVESSWDSPHCRVKLYVDSGDGKLVDTGIEPELTQEPPNVWMRREVTRELLDRGVQYLMFGADEFGGKDLYENQKEWGIRLIGEESGVWLFEIEPYKRVLQR
ncbi:hypothetical protein F183_A29110 [Bryobacterales bacterium F-183]|nr:hypothetical protein F183_A29110 [Bryobacterales bacterium F-183]